MGYPGRVKVTKLVVEYWTPVVLWLITIFMFSGDSFSAGQTSRILGPILAFLFPGLSQDEIRFLHGVIRKCAHVAAYFILAVLAYRSLKHQQKDLIQPKVRTFACVALAALGDEFNQSFSAYRGASIMDVGYDCFGAVWALWLITIYEIRRLRPHPIL